MAFKSTVSQQWHGEEVKIMGKKVVGKSAYETGLVVEGQAKLLCPVDQGYLSASITTQGFTEGTDMDQVRPAAGNKGISRKQQHRNFWQAMPEGFQKIKKPAIYNEVLVGTAVEYGPHIEFGTIKMDAQPFLRPALALARGKVVTIVERNAKMHFKKYLLEHDAYLKSRGVT